MNAGKLVVVVREINADAATLAATTAKQLGVKLVSNLRWYGGAAPGYRGALLSDGREIRIAEPK